MGTPAGEGAWSHASPPGCERASTRSSNGAYDVYLRDRAAGTVQRVSLDSSGQEAWGDSTQPRIAGDGAFFVFSSEARDIAPPDTNAAFDTFRGELSTGAVVRVSLRD